MYYVNSKEVDYLMGSTFFLLNNIYIILMKKLKLN